MTLGELFGELCEELTGSHEAVIVLEEASGKRLSSLFGDFSQETPPEFVNRVRQLAARRRLGEPLQHVIGHWGFRRLDLLQDQRALVVRPETEAVVEVALTELGRYGGGARRALDLGTGSGAIALSLVQEMSELQVLATDRSLPALALAALNRTRLPEAVRERVCLVASDWYSAIVRRPVVPFHCIVSNPPYIAAAEWAELDPVVRDFDPKDALVAGPVGLEAVEEVLRGAPGRLRHDGVLVCEIGADQGNGARALAQAHGAHEVRVGADLAGRDRVLVARF